MSDVEKFIPLTQGAGYGVVVGVGALFAMAMMLTTYVLRRYNKEIMTAEEFATAGRSVSICEILNYTMLLLTQLG